MKVGKVVPQDFHVWENRASAVLMVLGCNMQCPYCYSSNLVRGEMNPIDWLPQIKRVVHSIDSVVITGGEPLIQSYLPVVCKKLKLEGLKVRIETNGSKPGVLESLIKRKVVDSVALDVKAPFTEYNSVTRSQVDPEEVKKSMELLKNSGVDYEFRTTWSPDLTEEQILEVAKQCSGSAWVLQQFVPGNCLDESYNHREQTPYEKLKEIASRAEGPSKIFIKTDRGVELVR